MCSCCRRGSFETRSKISRTLLAGLPLLLVAFLLAGFSSPNQQVFDTDTQSSAIFGSTSERGGFLLCSQKRCWVGVRQRVAGKLILAQARSLSQFRQSRSGILARWQEPGCGL